MSSPAHYPRGFTLMELLIAIGIFTFGALAILALFNAAMVAHRTAVDRSTAALVAQNVVARMRLRLTRDRQPDAGSMSVPLPEPDRNYPDFRYTVHFQPIKDSRSISNPKLYHTYVMVVDAFWGPKKRERHDRFRTVIIRRGDLEF